MIRRNIIGMALLALLSFSNWAQAERLTSVTPNSVAPGEDVIVRGQFDTRRIYDRRYHYHLSLYPHSGGSAIHLTLHTSSSSTLTATVPRSARAGAYLLAVDMQQPGGGFAGSLQQSNKLPINVTRPNTLNPVKPARQVVATLDVPVITNIAPAVLTRGDRLLIKGHGFGRAQQAAGRKNTIRFSTSGGWVTIPIQRWTDTTILTRPLKQKPGRGNGPVKLHFYRNNREVLSKQAFLGFYNPKVLEYRPTRVRAGEPVLVGVQDIPPADVFRSHFAVALIKGLGRMHRLAPLDGVEVGRNRLGFRVPRRLHGEKLSVVIYRKSDSKIVSNQLPKLDVVGTAEAPVRITHQPPITELCQGAAQMTIEGGPFPAGTRVRIEPPSSYARPRVTIPSSSTLNVTLGRCFWLLHAGRSHLRIVFPDGHKSGPISFVTGAEGREGRVSEERSAIDLSGGGLRRAE